MKICIIKVTNGQFDRLFATADANAEHVTNILRNKNPHLKFETHWFDIKTSGKNANKLFEELPF